MTSTNKVSVVLAIALAVAQTAMPVVGQTIDHTTQTTQHPKHRAQKGESSAAQTADASPKKDSSAAFKVETQQQKPDNNNQTVSIAKLPTVTVERDGFNWRDLPNLFWLPSESVA